VKSSEFQLRLLRASEQNAHLREMNVAAAGLAHETRNPLNIIRGLAQMLSKEATVSRAVAMMTGAPSSPDAGCPYRKNVFTRSTRAARS